MAPTVTRVIPAQRTPEGDGMVVQPGLQLALAPNELAERRRHTPGPYWRQRA